MKKLLLLSLFIFITGCSPGQQSKLKTGDIIFQKRMTPGSVMFGQATKSEYSHMGMIYMLEAQPFVFEVVELVTLTPLDDWVRKGEGKLYTVKRLKNAEEVFKEDVLEKLEAFADVLMAGFSDPYFEWTDEGYYPSELVWKVYETIAETELCPLKKIKDLDFTNEAFARMMEEYYKGKIPMDENMVLPSDILNSEKLMSVE
ncbi:MAG: YiiX/YebB-like N1pC/P60 family cysteine hydrolase [bacterium]